LAEDEESLVGGEGDLVVVVEVSAVVDPAVGVFDLPTFWLDSESTWGFGPGHTARMIRDGESGDACPGGVGQVAVMA
jgi:hypothetical protein